MKHVVDASFIISFFLPDESGFKPQKAEVILREENTAPAILQLEVSNAILMARRRNRITGVEFKQLSEAFDVLRIILQGTLAREQRREVLQLAERHNLTVYDAAYLELS